jgi:predicted RNase H-like nuclease (RuvC/YqgF family)
MECVYLDLGGGGPKGFGWKVRCLAEKIRLESPVLGRKDSVGKSGAWPKRFGWKVRRLAERIRLEIRKSLENITFEIRKIMDISGIINLWGVD